MNLENSYPAQCLKIIKNVAFEFWVFNDWPFLAFLMNFLSTQNVKVARFARNDECDFFCDFQTL